MHQSPAAIFADMVARPVSGLTSTSKDAGESPSHARCRAQWLIDSPLLVYRCGGSAGIGFSQRPKHAPASRFTRHRSRSHREDGKAPDNFAGDANCRPGDWQAANAPYPLATLMDNGGSPAVERLPYMQALGL
jgi:hypothetical protein